MSYATKANWLDYVKVTCVFFMVFIHTFIWSTSFEDHTLKETPLSDIIISYSFFGWFALLIPMLSGCSLYGSIDRINTRNIIKISLILILSGFFLNGVVWGIKYMFEWDALHTIGVSYLIIYLFHRFANDTILFLFSLLFLVITKDTFSLSDNYLKTVLFGDASGSSYWSLFPWFFTIVFGFIFMKTHLLQKKFFALGVFIVSAFLLVVSYSSGHLFPHLIREDIWGSSVFQISYLHILGLIGVFGVLYLIGLFLEEKQIFSAIIRKVSKNIFWIYIIHVTLGYYFSLVIFDSFSWFRSFFFFVFILSISVFSSFLIDAVLSKRYYISIKKERK
jgi:hypothetical protein